MASDQLIRNDEAEAIKMDSEESAPGGSSVDEESGELGEGEDLGSGANLPVEQAPKRKGGRKPIYATTEERKQRNRQAQAAFRERRTEYIKQLENTISTQEIDINNLTAAHRQTTDELLMLRYKDSLMKRILLEKGIDVAAEIQAMHGSSNFGPPHPVPQMLPPSMSRTLLNRGHHLRRPNANIAPKIETDYILPLPVQPSHLAAGTPTARGAVASPTNPDGFGPSPTSSDNVPGAVRPMKQPGHPMGRMPPSSRMMPSLQPRMGHHQGAAGCMGNGGPTPAFYQNPRYQSHLEQLEQEYENAADMMDEQQQQQGQSEGEPGGLGPYPGSFYASHATQQQQQHQQQLSPTSTAAESAGQPPPPQQQQQVPQHQHGMSMGGVIPDPMADSMGNMLEPFGLELDFPHHAFSFVNNNMR